MKNKTISSSRRHLNNFLNKHKKKLFGTLLDVGCGVEQRYKKLFPQCDYIGIDKMIGDKIDVLREIPYQFDCFLCLQMLEHVEDPIKVLRNILEKFNENGIGIVSVPIAYRPHFLPFDYYRFTKQFPRVLEYVGFKVLDVSISDGVDVGICCLVKKIT